MPLHSSSLSRVRDICLALPDTSERLSHGAPTFFVRKKRAFVMYMDNHHNDGRLALWCAAPDGLQEALAGEANSAYFVPPYVGHQGWVGIRLDRNKGWDEIAGLIEDAYLSVASKA
ncbi:MAG TPA: MmcQ/YjbR family DNA-binding protein [Candidatus Dormibacteraeota bacterium]|jgi:predicted DNA-binding protein (MmcQ/YjbR family)